MNIRSNSARLAIAAAALSLSGAAHAVLLTSAAPSTNFSWSYNTGSSLLTGFGSISLSGFNSSSLTAAISLSNTSQAGGQGGERLTGFGFGIDPNVSGVSFSDAADGGMIGAAAGSLPSLGNIEVCSRSGPNCNGGANGGIYAGLSDAFSIIMAGTWGSSVDIDPIGIRYQTGYGSFTFTTSASSSTTTTSSTSSTGGTTTSSTSSGTTTSSSTTSSTTSTSSGTTTSTSSGTIAEPATSSMALLGLGLLGFALRRTRGVEKA